jgi:hypothetical protein
MEGSVFWNITPYSSLKVNRRFGGTCCLHFQVLRISQARYQRGATKLLYVGFLIGLFFDTEDGEDIFIRNVGLLSTDYRALYHRNITVQTDIRIYSEFLKFLLTE